MEKNHFEGANKQNLPQSNKSRLRISSADEFIVDIDKAVMNAVFVSFYEALALFEDQVKQTPVAARFRGFEANLFNAKLIERVQANFPENWKKGKYGRFFLSISNYVFLFKKLSNAGKPMNIITNNVEAINNQQMGSLFGDSILDLSPIIYFGYKKNKFGEIMDPQFVYIDEGEVKWRLNANDISDTVNFVKQEEAAEVKPASAKLKIKRKKAE